MARTVRKKVLVPKKWVRVLLLLTILALASFAVYLIYQGFVPIINKKSYYNYNIKRNIDYRVHLKENDYYQDKFLKKGEPIPSAIFDYVDINFSFLYSDSKQTKYEYTYYVKGRLVGEYEDSKLGKQEVWKQDYIFLEPQEKKSNGTLIDLNNTYRIYYDEYNSIVEKYKQEYRIAIDSYLEIVAHVKYKSILEKDVIEDEDDLIVKIPLSKTFTNITTKYSDETNDDLLHEIVNYDYKKIYIGFVLIILTIVAFSYAKDIIFTNNKTAYRKMLDKILKDYSEIIAETSTPIDLSEVTVYDISDFQDLVDIEEELKSPIMLYEYMPGEICYFVVLNDSLAYRYTLDIEEL